VSQSERPRRSRRTGGPKGSTPTAGPKKSYAVRSAEHQRAAVHTPKAPQQLGSEPVRLQKYLAACGIASRRSAEELIQQGIISVNGKTVRELGTKVDPRADEVRVRGQVVRPAEPKLYLFFKPRHVLTTLRDPEGRPCVGDYLKKLPTRVFPVGRLDGDVTGLLLLTNDGDFGDQLLHPRYGAKRVYWAMLLHRPTEQMLRGLSRGVEVDGEVVRAEDVRIMRDTPLAQHLFGDVSKRRVVLQLSVREGKQHFVKKLLETAGFSLVRLGRVAFGPFELRGLKPGEIVEKPFRRLARRGERASKSNPQSSRATRTRRRR